MTATLLEMKRTDFKRDCLAYRAWGLVEVLADMSEMWDAEKIVSYLRQGACELQQEREALCR